MDSPQEKIRIMIVDDVPEGREGLARLLSFEPDMEVIGFASTGAEAIERAQELLPDVILMDINMPDMDGIQATEKVTQIVPVSVIMVSVQSDRDYMRRAMQVGAMDFLPKPPSADELYATVRNAYIRRPRPEQVTTCSVKSTTATSQQAVAGKIIVVYSPQGGAGATTLAVNIASGLMDENHRAVLIDANLQFGDVAVHLAIPNERNIIDLGKAADDLDPDLIENVLSTHGTGLRVLPAPKQPQDAELIAGNSVPKVVEAMAGRFSYVVVDTAPHLDDVTIGLFDVAHKIIMVGVPTLPCVRNIRVVLDLLDQFADFDKNKIAFVMNKVPTDRKSGALDIEAISNTLKLPVAAIIPSVEKVMLGSLNRGVPVIVNARQSPGKEIVNFTSSLQSMLQGDEEEELELELEDEKKGLLRRFIRQLSTPNQILLSQLLDSSVIQPSYPPPHDF